MRIRLLNEYVKLARQSWLDMMRYAKHACLGWNRDRYDAAQHEGRVIATYHVIEKGLSMPDFRPLFGVSMVKQLIRLLQQGGGKFNWCQNINYLTGVKVVRSYMDKHHQLGEDLCGHFSKEEINFGVDIPCDFDLVAGAQAHRRESYFAKARSEFTEFARSRHSCRVFDLEKEVELGKIQRAIDAARFTPSVCNRQCWRVHVFLDKGKVEELLSCQGGNRGFGHTIPVVFVVTSNLNVFDGYLERNQAYIDGGLFSMSLMYGLHNQELGCVPLCWLENNEREKKLRQLAGIGPNEVIMMLMGVGNPAEKFSAPSSQRRSVEEISVIH